MTSSLLLLLALVSAPQDAVAKAPLQSIELEFCQLTPSEIFRKMGGELRITYHFVTDPTGRPTRVWPAKEGSLSTTFVNPVEVAACIRRWHLWPCTAGTRFTTTFIWRQGTGWTSLEVAGAGESVRLTLSGDPCPYGDRR